MAQGNENVSCPQCKTVFPKKPGSRVSTCPFCDYQIIHININNSSTEENANPPIKSEPVNTPAPEENKVISPAPPAKERKEETVKPTPPIDTYYTLDCPEDRLFVDFTSNNSKIKLKVWIEGTKNKKRLKTGQSTSFNLKYGEYAVLMKMRRKTYGRLITIAPGDQPIRIHCSWDNKVYITMEQSKYAEMISQKRRGSRFWSKWLDVLTTVYNVLSILVFVAIFLPSILLAIMFLIEWIIWKLT